MTDNGWSIGVDLGGTFVKLAVLDPDGALVHRLRLPTRGHDGYEIILDRIGAAIRDLAARPGVGELTGVGMGLPGLIDMAAGEVRELTNLPGHWPNVPAAAILSSATGLPVHLINDARAFTLAEHRLGAARGVDTAVCAAVGTGIGGGVVAHGRVVFGLGGAAGEFGHAIVQPGGAACSCGNRGCAEPLSTGPAIAAEAMRRCVQGFTTDLPNLVDGDLNAITPELVDQAAEAGDAVAREILEDAGRWFGLALVGAISILAPEVVVLGGGVLKPNGIYWNAAVSTARNNVHVCEIDRVRFEPAALGYDAGVIGAALWGRPAVRAGE